LRKTPADIDADGLEVVLEAGVVVPRMLREQRRIGERQGLVEVVHRKPADEIRDAWPADRGGEVRAQDEVPDRLVPELKIGKPGGVVRRHGLEPRVTRLRRRRGRILQARRDPRARLLPTDTGGDLQRRRELQLRLPVTRGYRLHGPVVVEQRIARGGVEVHPESRRIQANRTAGRSGSPPGR
jgi:hypothetical protein